MLIVFTVSVHAVAATNC